MTEGVDQLHHHNAPAHSTALVQALFWPSITSPRSISPLQLRFGSLRLLAFPRAKIAVEGGEICECDGHTVHKLGQQRLTADWLDPRLTADWLDPWESDCSRMRSKVSSDWLPSYIKATRPVLEIFKMDAHIPDRRRTCVGSSNCSNKPLMCCDEQMWFKGKHNGGGLHKE